MSLLNGSVSFVRFTVEGDLPDNFWDFIADRVVAHGFQDIDDNMEEYSIGWVSMANMFDSDFAYASYAAGDFVVLTMRVDERKVPPAVLKKFTLKEEERIKKEKQIPKLSRSARLEIKERISAELIRKSDPIPVCYDLYWNPADKNLLFCSTSKKAMIQLEELFKDTFDCSIILQIPWILATHLADEETTARLDSLQPAILL